MDPGQATTANPSPGSPPPASPAPASPTAARGGAATRSAWRKPLLIVGGHVVGISVLVFVIIPWAWRAWTTVSTDDAYVNGHLTFAAPRVSGQVVQVLVDDNNRVRKGAVLVRLDSQPYEIAVRLNEALVANATADLAAVHDQMRAVAAEARSNRFKLEHTMEDVRNQLALLRSRVAELKVEQANLVLAEADFTRGEALIKTRAISTQQYDQFKAALGVAKNRVVAAENAIQQTRASLGLPVNAENPLDVPENLDQDFSAVRQALFALLSSVAPLGVYPQHYNATPKQIIEEFYRRDPEGNLDRILEKLVGAAPAVKQAQARLDQARANLEQARLNLSWCDVKSDIDGVVTRRNVNPGDNLQAGQSVMAIRSLTEIWIDANFKETQLAELRIGQRVELDVDMYGRRRTFDARVTGFTMGTGSTLSLLPAQNATGNFIKVVQRLPVRIELTNYNPDQDPLFVGLSVVPYVFVKEPAAGPDAGKVLQPVMVTAPAGAPGVNP